MLFTKDDKSFLNQPLVKQIKEEIKENILEQRITDLHKAPIIKQHSSKFSIITPSKNLELNTENMDKETILDSLCILYGYGFVKYNYDLPIFHDINKAQFKTALRLATEIWDKRIHIDWMRNYCKHINHDISKDLHFCKLLVQERYTEAKEYHHNTCRKGYDTNHHEITIKEFSKMITEQDTSSISEIFNDQASIAGRYYEKLKSDNLSSPHYLMQQKIIEKGVILKQGKKDYFWIPSQFNSIKIPIELQMHFWNKWKTSNKNFKQYWNHRFGQINQNWQPPVDITYFNLLK